ncbi:MAG: L,D-transpeptidase family protein [Mucilaginibacter sp.]|nr:L,D-transpeptidase family protein [Mucilaginibacter sp.]
MIIVTSSKNPIPLTFIFLLLAAGLLTQSCTKKKRSELGEQLFIKTQNKVFKDADADSLAVVFKEMLQAEKSKMNQPQIITAFYEQNNYDPAFVMDHTFNGDIDLAANYFEKAGQHGLDPKMFKADQIKQLAAKIRSKTAIKSLKEAYHDMAMLEMLTANSLVNYANALQYGLISPKKIYQRYFMATKRPDSTSMFATLRANNLKTLLDSIQPKNPQYLLLQKALIAGGTAEGMTKEETQHYLVVNMERLRWRNKPYEPKYVIVNIPDYRLDVIENGESVLNMKVIVGEGHKDNTISLKDDNESNKEEKPVNRETPQLNSKIYAAQVNPVWNIPRSIATKEIMIEADEDPYYLENKGIDVYKNGKKMEDPETIDWLTAKPGDYEFKQRPGDENSLGKIKFLFNNNSSVYLHDTPARNKFNEKMRALSHGCVRVGDPLALAKNLFGESPSYDTIAKDMAEPKPSPTTLDLPKKVPVYLTYVTCWMDGNGTLQYRPDVYGLDEVLYGHLKKFLADSETLAGLTAL